MSLSSIDSRVQPAESMLAASREDDDQSMMQQLTALSPAPKPAPSTKLAGKVLPIEGNSTINSSNAFLMEQSITDTKLKPIVNDEDVDSLFNSETQDAIVQKIKERQRKDKSMWWKDQYGNITVEKQPFYLKDSVPNPKLLPVK